MGAVDVNVPEAVFPVVGWVGLTAVGSAPPAKAELAVAARARNPIIAAIVFGYRIRQQFWMIDRGRKAINPKQD